MDPITAALAAGAAAGLSDVATQAVKDAYGRLKSALAARFPQVEPQVHVLEVRPSSRPEQASLAVELAEAGAERDAELLQLARALLEAIAREVPEAAAKAGVDLDRVRAGGSLTIENAEGSDVGVRGRDLDVAKDITIRGARGGGGPDPNR